MFKHHKYYYQGFFTSLKQNDSAWAAKKYNTLKMKFYDCLSGWSHEDVIDSRRNFPFTRFTKDSTQLELYYLKNSYDDSSFTVGVVVEAW